jgi:hypothetical protein
MKTQLHFIVGIGRSGTTLLTKILNKHQDIHCQPEANFLLFFLNHFKNQIGFSEADIDLIFKQIEIYSLSHPLIGWKFDPIASKNHIKEICKNNSTINYENLCIQIYRCFEIEGIDKSKSTIIIDKNPAYTILINKISEALPESKFIWMIRDYRANVLSRKQSAYLKSPAVAYNAIRWAYFNYLALRFSKKNKQKILLIKYEDLVTENELTMQKIYDFLKLDIVTVSEKDTITFQANKDLPGVEKHEKYLTKKYADLNKPINADRKNSWQTELTKEEIILCDSICGDFAKQLKYEKYYKISSGTTLLNFTKNIFTILKSILDIEKDKLLYYLPIHYKLKRLIKRHKILGFLK